MVSSKIVSYVGLVIFGASLMSAVPVKASSGEEEFGCRGVVQVNYALPLEKMPPVHRPPGFNGQAPFAPPGVTVVVPVPTVLAGGGRIGLEVIGGSVRLGWTVVSTLNRVRRDGVVTKVLRSKRQRISRIGVDLSEQPDLLFSVSGKPALYRVNSIFFDASGRRLGEYAQYFRTLRSRTEYRESVSPRMIHGGEVLVARTENPGTSGLGLGVDFAVDRFEEGEWKLDPITPKGFPGIGIFIFGGITYECRSLRLPGDMAPGHYRYRKEVEVAPGQTRSIAADFFVLP